METAPNQARTTGRTLTSALALGCSLLVTCAFAAGASAATIVVNTGTDEVAADAHCSLREALTAANTDAAPHSGAGECAAGSGDDTIQLAAGTFKLTIPGTQEDANATGDLDVTGGPVTIVGAGAATTTIDGNHIDRVLDVRPGRVLTLRGMTITGGLTPGGTKPLDVQGTPGSGSGPGEQAEGQAGTDGLPGGGILDAGSVTVIDSKIAGNGTGRGGDGGGAYGGAGGATAGTGGVAVGGRGGHGGAGGGIFDSGTLTLTRAVVSGNATGGGGQGGIGVGGDGGASGGGGGIGLGGSGGDGGDGGGIAESGGGGVTVDQSSITGNATGAGGAGNSGLGGFGGHGSGSGAGGTGASGVGGVGGDGGSGGGLAATDTLNATNDLVAANTTGNAGAGGEGDGGGGGTGGDTAGKGGAGGVGVGGTGGSGGTGGGVEAGLGNPSAFSLVDVTLTASRTGDGNTAGEGDGGHGGAGGINGGNGGKGGDGDGGIGGPGGRGSALFSDANLTVTHATITSGLNGAGGGTAAGVGGGAGAGRGGGSGGAAGTGSAGLGGSPGTAAIFHSTGFGTTLTAANTIVAGNAAPSCSGVSNGGHDISFPDTTCPGANVDPKLAPLADNGGPTQTQALGAGSQAIDAVPATGASCAATDQRLVPRPQGPGCDIGAYEHAAPAATTADATAVSLSGATLHGQVTPNSKAATYHFDLGTSTAYGTATAAQDAGGGIASLPVSATVTALAPGTTFHYRLVATNGDGTTFGADRTFTTLPPPSQQHGQLPVQPPGLPSDTVPPAFLAASISPATFAVDPRGAAEVAVAARARRHAHKGAVFGYTMSEAARVVFTIERLDPGRKAGGACAKPTRANRRKPACKRVSLVGRFAATATAGANRHAFSGRIGRRALSPGSYRATLVATDLAGNASQPQQLTFTIVKR